MTWFSLPGSSAGTIQEPDSRRARPVPHIQPFGPPSIQVGGFFRDLWKTYNWGRVEAGFRQGPGGAI